MEFTIVLIVILIMSAVVHEVSHGAMAYYLGDTTAKDAGRLTLNPLKHLDPVGSVLVPLFLVLLPTRFFIAWAKPVPYNPYRLSDAKYGPLKVALAGPGSNLILAVIFGLLARALPLSQSVKVGLAENVLRLNSEALLSAMSGDVLISVFVLSIAFVFINLILMVFNLIPVPPLDGSKIILTFLPEKGRQMFYQLEPYGMFLLLFLIMSGVFSFVVYAVIFLLALLVGV